LIVIEGVGWVGTRDGSKFEIRPGDVIVTEPNEEHWHGATNDNLMTHYAITPIDQDGNAAHWGVPVTDADYLG
jgi:quercetin dioxygenase-like cupin family protein